MILGHGVKGQGQLWHSVCIRPCGHNTDYSLYPTLFKLHTQVVDERADCIDFWSRGQRSSSTLHSVYKGSWAQYRLKFKLNHFQTSHVSCGC